MTCREGFNFTSFFIKELPSEHCHFLYKQKFYVFEQPILTKEMVKKEQQSILNTMSDLDPKLCLWYYDTD